MTTQLHLRELEHDRETHGRTNQIHIQIYFLLKELFCIKININTFIRVRFR